ncbi:MAG TPA: bifunctional RNase H/acid phosphatase [Micromonosporaceae bacterium]
MKVVVEADGGARGNPGPAGYGAVVRSADTGEVLAERSEAIGVATNNVAEYRGLIAGLEAAAALGATEVQVRMDAKLVIEQMSGRWRIKHPGLRPLAAQAARLVRGFDTVAFVWVPRERNRHADALANAAMDLAAGKVPKPSRPASEPASGRAPTPAVASSATAADGTPGPGSWEPRAAESATRLLLVRHGETEFTAQRRYSGRGDVPLTPKGVEQARAVAVRVAGLAPQPAVVLTSPLSRCTATAEAIAGVTGAAVVVDPDLVECDFGAWEGRTFAEVRAQWPAELDVWLASTQVAPPGGESFAQIADRLRRFRAKLSEKYRGQAVVVVSHVSPLKLLLRDALAAGDAFLHRLYLDPGGISIVDSWSDGGVAVRCVNDTSHLPAR